MSAGSEKIVGGEVVICWTENGEVWVYDSTFITSGSKKSR